MREESRVIFNADDFGHAEGVNRGILECHLGGVVTSASLMVRRRAVEQAAALAREHATLSVGLHWDGEWCELDSDDPAAVREELARQLETFHDLLGRIPTHVDSHHHMHRDEHLLPVFQELVEPLGVPLRGDGQVAYVGGFYAQWEWQVTNLEYVSFEFLERLLREEVTAAWTELGCHPGYVTPDLHSSYAEEREAELRTLTDPRVRAAIDDLGLRLAGFEDFNISRAAGADRS